MLILIGGPTASGKSTFAVELAERIRDASVVRMDDFYYDSEERRVLELGSNWDDPKMLHWRMFHEVMAKVLAGEEVGMPHYNKRDGSRTFARFKPGSVVLLEGIWVMHERAGLEGDLCLYVDESRTKRLQRRIDRGIKKEGRTQEKILYMWKNHVVPMEEVHVFPAKEKVDLVVTEENSEGSIKNVLKIIEARSSARQV
jgi:uridine kinase